MAAEQRTTRGAPTPFNLLLPTLPAGAASLGRCRCRWASGAGELILPLAIMLLRFRPAISLGSGQSATRLGPRLHTPRHAGGVRPVAHLAHRQMVKSLLLPGPVQAKTLVFTSEDSPKVNLMLSVMGRHRPGRVTRAPKGVAEDPHPGEGRNWSTPPTKACQKRALPVPT